MRSNTRPSAKSIWSRVVGKARRYLLCDQSIDRDPHDPRVDRLIDEPDAGQRDQEADLTRVAGASPAWRRILGVFTGRARRRAESIT